MGAARIFALAGVISTAATATLAADLRLPPQPAPVVAPVDTGWYLRGYLGMSNQFFNGLSHPTFLTADSFGWYDKGGFDSAPFGGVGVGYTVNNWLRFDVTGEYRGKSNFMPSIITTITALPPTTTRPASPSGSGSSTPISISARGGASRPMSALASASRQFGSTISAIST